MSEPTATTQAVVHQADHHEPQVISPDITLMILTWVSFFILLGVLYKFAWKPILSGLQEREDKIRKSLEDAQKAQEEYRRVKDNTDKMIAEADEQAKFIVERSKKAAVEAAKVIERQAKEEAQIQLNNAQQEIARQTEKVRSGLCEEGAQLAVELAGKILSSELDEAKHQKLVDQFIKDFHPEKSHAT